jgi:ELWxxDGT repeat protein
VLYIDGSSAIGVGREAHVIDLTTGAGSLLRDIAPGTQSSRPRDFTPLGDGRLVFSAASGDTGPARGNRDVDLEPWVTDGTRAGTFKLADLNPDVVGPSPIPGDGSSNPSLWASLGDGRAVFTIDAQPLFPGGVNERRPIYITDGTVAGTRPVLDARGEPLTYDTGAFGVPPFVAQFAAPTLSIAPRRADRLEGDAGTTPFTFTVTRDGARLDAASVGWRVVGTGANPADGADFAGPGLPSGAVRLGPGVAERVVTVQVRGDAAMEPDETFAVRLVNPDGADIARGQAGGVIRSDDVPIIGTGRGDRLRGADKDDRIDGRAGPDALFGQGGDDLLFGGGGNDLLHGGTGRDRLFGGGGADELDGGAGADRLFGGGGADRLDGGAGNDVLTGGPGADVFAFGPRSGRDAIVDFGRGADRIDLGGRSDVASFRDLRGDIVQRGADAEIRPGGGRDVIVLRDVDADGLRAGDFLFG